MNNIKTEIVIALVSAFLAVLGTLLVIHIQNRTISLEYGTHTIEGILSPVHGAYHYGELEGDSVEITINHRPIDNLSILHVYVANLSDKDLGEVPMFFELHSHDDQPIKILNYDYFDQNRSKES